MNPLIAVLSCLVFLLLIVGIFVNNWLDYRAVAVLIDDDWVLHAQGWRGFFAQWPLLLAALIFAIPLGMLTGVFLHDSSHDWEQQRQREQLREARQKTVEQHEQLTQYQTLIAAQEARIAALEAVPAREIDLIGQEEALAQEKTALEQAKDALHAEKTENQRYWQGWAEQRVRTAELAIAEAQRQSTEAEQRRHNAAATAERLRRKLQRQATPALPS